MYRSGIFAAAAGTGPAAAWLPALMILFSGILSLFEQEFMMGHEGKMILVYLGCEKKISEIQLERTGGVAKAGSVVLLACGCAGGFLMGIPVRETLLYTCMSVFALAAGLMVNGFFLISRTKYLNEMAVPDMVSRTAGSVLITMIELLFLVPLFAGLFPQAWSWIVAAVFAAYTVLITVFRARIRKGDRYFYGEYQKFAC